MLLAMLIGNIFVGILKAQSPSDFYITDDQGNQNPLLSCNYPFISGTCVKLTAHYPQFKLTDKYNVSSILFSPYSSTSQTVIKQNLDDEFTGIIPLPFTFCFYGKAYDKIVIGSNGMISFDTNQANQPNAPNFSDSLPSSKLPKESIFGVLHNMVFSTTDTSEINYSVIGTAPFRKFIVNFHEGKMFNCNSLTSTSQIVLSEGSNTVEVFVKNKDLPCSLTNFKNSLIGINDSTGNLGLAAPGRNTGVWSATNEAWIFTPAGNNLVPVFNWYDSSGTLIGNGSNVIVCPNIDETYRVDIVYAMCNGSSETYSDNINLQFDINYPTVKSYTQIICDITQQITLSDYKQFLTTNNISNFNFEFRDAITGVLVNENTPFTIPSDKDFNVTVISKTSPTCKRNTTLKLKFFSDNILTNILNVCDRENNGVENGFILSKLNEQLVGAGYTGTVGYFDTKADALVPTNEIKIDNLVNGKQYYIRLSNQGCNNVLGPVTINFNPTPIVFTPQPIIIKLDICDFDDDGVEPYSSVKNQIEPLITSDAGVSLIRIFNTRTEAENAISTDTGLTDIIAGNYTIFARVEYPSGCFSIVEINFNLTFGSIKLSNSDTFICFDGVQDIPVDLVDLTKSLLISPTDGSVTGPRFYEFLPDAVAGSPTLPANQFSITDDGDIINKQYFARYDTSKCYSIKPINITLIHLVKNIDQFNDICDYKGDGKETINLDNYKTLVNNQPGGVQVEFYDNPAATGTSLLTAEVNNTASLVLYAKVSLHGCTLVFPVTFSLKKAPDVKTNYTAVVRNVCDNNADGVENLDIKQYESAINFNGESVDFNYYKNYDEATDTFSDQYPNYNEIPVSNGTIVYAMVNFRGTNCYIKSKITFDVQFNPSIYLTKNVDLKLCDKDKNFGEFFNLELAKPDVFDPSINTINISDIDIKFYKTETDANNGTSVGQISNNTSVTPNVTSYPTYSGNETIYVRYQSRISGCYSVAPINLLSVFPANTTNSIINICDNNLDGFYDVNLLNYLNQMVQTPTSDNKFTFFTDILNPSTKIQNPENFILNPYVSKIWVNVENLKDCNSIAEIFFTNGTQIPLTSNHFTIKQCDTGNDEKEDINLSQFESSVGAYHFDYYKSLQNMNDDKDKISNFNPYPFDKNIDNSKFYVKVSDGINCPNFFTIDVDIPKIPIVNIGDYYYCKNNLVGIDIRPNFTGFAIINYKWEYPDGTIVEGATEDFLTGVKTVGVYKLTLTNTALCSYTNTFNVINVDTPEIVSLTGENDSYTIVATGITGRKIVYSKDLINWQDSNIFKNLLPGEYNFYVKYEDSDCYSDVKKGKIFFVNNAFTPNNDGINDYWKLTGLNIFPDKSSLEIFDKYGNLVYTQSSNTEFIWDGKVNGRNLPTDAYWYVIKAADKRIYTGWILLKNRN